MPRLSHYFIFIFLAVIYFFFIAPLLWFLVFICFLLCLIDSSDPYSAFLYYIFFTISLTIFLRLLPFPLFTLLLMFLGFLSRFLFPKCLSIILLQFIGFISVSFIPSYSLSPFKILSIFHLIHLCFYVFIIYDFFFSVVHFKVACVLSCFLGSWSCYIYLFSCPYPRYLTICKSIYL